MSWIMKYQKCCPGLVHTSLYDNIVPSQSINARSGPVTSKIYCSDAWKILSSVNLCEFYQSRSLDSHHQTSQMYEDTICWKLIFQNFVLSSLIYYWKFDPAIFSSTLIVESIWIYTVKVVFPQVRYLI